MSDKDGNIEHYERRFGVIAIEKGFITPDDLIKALMVQVHEEIEYETHRQTGEILFDQGIMSGNQIEEVVKAVLQQ